MSSCTFKKFKNLQMFRFYSSLFIVSYGTFCFLTGSLWNKLHNKENELDEDEKNENICQLKNALLIYNLLKLRKQDFENCNEKNPKLPALAGCTFDTACFCYLVPRRLDRNDPWYTKSGEQERDKIRKYLCQEFSDAKKTEAFFLKVLEKDEIVDSRWKKR